MKNNRILLVRKMSAYEYHYKGETEDQELIDGHINHGKSIEDIIDLLKKAGKPFDLVTLPQLSEEFVSQYEAVISAGGDGNVTKVARHNRDVPQLNVVTEGHSFGALCQHDLPGAINALVTGNYRIENWTRQAVYLDGNFVGNVTNETGVGELLKFTKFSKYFISFLDSETLEQRTDELGNCGLVVVTGTGSTAWKAFNPYPRSSEIFKFTAVMPHRGIINEGSAKNLKIEYRGHEGAFALDTVEYKFPRGSVLEIKLSEHPLRVIVPNTESTEASEVSEAR